MVTVGMNYDVIEGKGEIFENAFRGVVNLMKEMDGHVDTHLYRDIDASLSYLIVSSWDKREAYDAFIGSEKFAQVTNWGKEQILAGRPRHEVYETKA